KAEKLLNTFTQVTVCDRFLRSPDEITMVNEPRSTPAKQNPPSPCTTRRKRTEGESQKTEDCSAMPAVVTKATTWFPHRSMSVPQTREPATWERTNVDVSSPMTELLKPRLS